MRHFVLVPRWQPDSSRPRIDVGMARCAAGNQERRGAMVRADPVAGPPRDRPAVDLRSLIMVIYDGEPPSPLRCLRQ